ncbi:hypothetical protein OUZ56_005149 [Daphnia magna]|uniref:Uncharacterized protein n=1 Tax=Daphnia magna TaxID=35525 RepID=A0ABQ9YRY8_9CRUS|nr:hypothetical protein OUZ56_005149 [Daphnia magna]
METITITDNEITSNRQKVKRLYRSHHLWCFNLDAVKTQVMKIQKGPVLLMRWNAGEMFFLSFSCAHDRIGVQQQRRRHQQRRIRSVEKLLVPLRLLRSRISYAPGDKRTEPDAEDEGERVDGEQEEKASALIICIRIDLQFKYVAAEAGTREDTSTALDRPERVLRMAGVRNRSSEEPQPTITHTHTRAR